MHIGVQGDVARESPIADVVVHNSGVIDLAAELHVFASQLAGEQMLARHHEVVLCDKSLLSVIAYTRLFLAEAMPAADVALFDAMTALAYSYASRYDVVFLLTDRYALRATVNPYRPAYADLRARAAELIRAECEAAGVVLEVVPRGLETVEKVDWVLARFATGDDG